jgi:hypothetical protein
LAPHAAVHPQTGFPRGDAANNQSSDRERLHTSSIDSLR